MYSRAKRLIFEGVQRPVLTPVRIFLISTMVVNGGNYLYNLSLGRFLTPAQFAEAGFMVTLLLIFSFIGMTFQVSATKFTVDLNEENLLSFKKWIVRLAMIVGVGFTVVMLCFAQQISNFFNLSNHYTLIVFVVCLPLYFLMSVYRGFRQGSEAFVKLSYSYQIETWGRFLITFVLLYFLRGEIGISVSIAIVVSILLGGWILVEKEDRKVSVTKCLSADIKQLVVRFFIVTAGYEVAQVMINYGDLLLVKHYFDAHQAGLYTSLSLIGKMIYFVAWMVVMILIPKILNLKKKGMPFKSVMLRFVMQVALLTSFVTLLSFLFPEFIVARFFGEAYVGISAYLWIYALATSLFALANIFVYYFLSLDEYVPVFMAIGIGFCQVVSFLFFHSSIEQIIWIQVFFMGMMLMIQVGYFMRSR